MPGGGGAIKKLNNFKDLYLYVLRPVDPTVIGHLRRTDANVREYGALLQRAGFALPVADAETLTLRYASPREVMREVRALGGGNVLLARSRKPLSRQVLERAEALYRERHATEDGLVRASYEIVYFTGWAPDPSQQKPLKPGSAAQRLADALGTKEQSAGDKAAFPSSMPKARKQD